MDDTSLIVNESLKDTRQSFVYIILAYTSDKLHTLTNVFRNVIRIQSIIAVTWFNISLSSSGYPSMFDDSISTLLITEICNIKYEDFYDTNYMANHK